MPMVFVRGGLKAYPVYVRKWTVWYDGGEDRIGTGSGVRHVCRRVVEDCLACARICRIVNTLWRYVDDYKSR